MSNNILFPFVERPTTIWGLKYRPTVNDSFDALDWSDQGMINGQPTSLGHKFGQIQIEFSSKNKQALLDVLNNLKSKNRLNAILEIGVFRSQEESSTRVMLNNKNPSTKYLGIDLVENNLAPIRNHAENVYGLACDSSNYEIILKYAKEACGIEQFDLVMIDGYHSINQVMDDWKFAQNLAPNGVVLMHDSNFHPGPYCVYEAIDESLFDKQKLCVDPVDWGLAMAVKKA